VRVLAAIRVHDPRSTTPHPRSANFARKLRVKAEPAPHRRRSRDDAARDSESRDSDDLIRDCLYKEMM